MFILLARPKANLYNTNTMNAKVKLWMLVIFLTAMTAHNGLAQSPSNEGDVFDDIRTQMLSAAQKNSQLAEENKELKAQLINLQLEVDRHEQDMMALNPDYTKAREQLLQLEAASDSLNGSEDDALIREAQNIYLSGQSMQLDESQRLRELQLYDLQYEKQERQLDLKSLEFVYEKIKNQRRAELEALQAEVKTNEAKAQETALRVAEQEKAALSYPQRVDLLEMENKALKQKIKQLKELSK